MRHEQRRAPFPETGERDQHYQQDGFAEGLHEQVDIFLDLQRLIGGAGDDQIRRQRALQLLQLIIDGFAEFLDLLAGTHVDRQRDGPAAMSYTRLIGPAVVIQILRGALIVAADLDQVAEIDGDAAT